MLTQVTELEQNKGCYCSWDNRQHKLLYSHWLPCYPALLEQGTEVQTWWICVTAEDNKQSLGNHKHASIYPRGRPLAKEQNHFLAWREIETPPLQALCPINILEKVLWDK